MRCLSRKQEYPTVLISHRVTRYFSFVCGIVLILLRDVFRYFKEIGLLAGYIEDEQDERHSMGGAVFEAMKVVSKATVATYTLCNIEIQKREIISHIPNKSFSPYSFWTRLI